MLAIAFGATGGITNAVFADDLGDFLGRRITRVDVVIDGATGTTDDLKAQLEVALGQDYSPVRIHESLVRLHKSGLASGARVEATAVGSDGVALTFIVKPQARIDAVVFEGPVIFQPGDLRARLGQLNTGDRLSEGAVSAGLDDLVAFYSSHGYYQAQVTSEVRPNVGGTRATVVYKINPGAQATVSRVTRDIRGEQVDLSKIKHALVEGKPFSQSAVEDEVEAIRQAYTAKDYLALRVSAKTAADMLNNSVAITIGVESGPRITVAVKGLDVSEKTKRELLPFYVHGGIDDFTLEEGRRRLLDHAQKEGYFFAEIARPALPDLGAAQVQIDYVVEPGSRYRLKDIDIDGLTAIPSADLQLLLKSKKALPISIFGYGRGVTSDDMLRQDANLIQRKLNELGYRRALVSARRGVSLTGENLIITFDVKEGPRSYVEQIGIRGNYVLTQEELRSQLSSVTEKAPLVTAEISRGADQLLAAYTNRGYAATEIGSELVDLGGVDSRDQVRVIYDVAESSRVRIRNVVTRGAALTDTGRLERDFYLFKENKQL
ncbi:MAG TPA: POTRA domain-containing protein, partial [Blastocatellia bacterium]|nr:POTRA domain-containing protein [Blastocatellia bacterium]